MTQKLVSRSLLETMTFVSGFNASIQHPLLYKHPIRHDDTIMLALGILSGQYIQTQSDGKTKVLSVEETQFIQGTYSQVPIKRVGPNKRVGWLF
jgi:hypothetical protein